MLECENSVEREDNTPTNVGKGQDLPNLLGEYDCGDEPEEQDDSMQAGSDGESGESENDNENDEPDTPAIEQKDEVEKNESKQINKDLELEPEEKEKPTINLLEYGDDELSK